MSRSRILDVPYITLTEAALDELAEHIEGLNDRQLRELVKTHRGYRSKKASESQKAYEARLLDEARGQMWDAGYSIKTIAGEAIDEPTWADIRAKVFRPDVLSLTMKGRGDDASVRVRLLLRGVWQENAKVELDSATDAGMNTEVGWFKAFFDRYKDVPRYWLSSASWTGKVIWFLVPGFFVWVLVVRLLTLVPRVPDPNAAVIQPFSAAMAIIGSYVFVTFFFGMFVSIEIAARAVPRVVIVGAGPNQRLRSLLYLLVTGVLTTGIGAAIALINPFGWT